MGEFWKRLVFGFLFVVVVIGSIIMGKLAASLMLLIVVMMASSEIVNLFPHEQDKPLKNIVGCCSVMLYVFFVFLSGNFDSMESGIYIAPIFFFVPLIIALFSKKHDYVSIVGASWLSMIFVALPCGIMTMFYNEELMGTDKGWGLLIFAYILIWVNDIFAYLTGSAIGRHKLCPRISPKKTIEGSVGGAVFTMLFAYFINRFLLNVFFFDNLISNVKYAVKNMLGLVCDPVAGLVEVPCVKRNVIGAVNAMTSCDMVIAGMCSKIPPDEVFDAMRSVGRCMPENIKETGTGGLAATPTGVKMRERITSL